MHIMQNWALRLQSAVKMQHSSWVPLEGHPDRLCDLLADGLLAACLETDPDSRVSAVACTKAGMVMVLGDATTKAVINSEQIVRDVVKDVKYDSEDAGLDWRTMNVIIGIDEPSIEAVISSADTYRPHESCVVTGYACNDTPEMQPLSYKIAETVATALAEVRKDGSILSWIQFRVRLDFHLTI